jgi:hypothetical protein
MNGSETYNRDLPTLNNLIIQRGKSLFARNSQNSEEVKSLDKGNEKENPLRKKTGKSWN